MPANATPYGPTLAAIHEAGFTGVAEAAARMVQDLRPPPARVVDLGCGPGTLAAMLSRRGYNVTGMDVSPSMLDLARAAAPEAVFIEADVGTTVPPRGDVVTAIGEVFSFAAGQGADLASMLERCAAALPADGLMLFDVASPGRAPGPGTQARRRGRGWEVHATAAEHGDRLVRTITTTTRHETETEVHELRMFTPGEMERAAARAGLDLEALGGYDDYGLATGWDAYLARPSRS